MDIPTKQLKSGFKLQAYGFGLWQVGGRSEADRSRDAEEIGAIRYAIGRGVTHFDAAESYGDGHAEELLGEAVRESGVDRKKLILASKVSAWNQRPDDLRRSLEASLKRLGTDYLDLYLLHRYPEPGIPIEETMEALDGLVAEGIVKHIGACNLSPNRFREAQKHASNKLVCNQVHYNVQYREAEAAGVLRFCQEIDVLLVAWRPLQKGALPETALVRELAGKYGKTPVQVALNWLLSQDNVVLIAKTSSPAHLDENLGALGWVMEDGDVERIRQEFPGQQARSDAVPLDYPADVEA